MPIIEPIRGLRINQTHPLARGLIGAWMFNEGIGNRVFDLSLNRRHGTLTNMDPQTDWIGGRDGFALDFDDTDTESVAIDGTFDPPNQGTVEMLYLVRSTTGDDRHYGFHDAYEIRVKTLGAGFKISNQLFAAGAAVLDGVIEIAFDTWHYVVCTYNFDTNRQEIYVDGVLDSSNDTTANDDPGTGTLHLGRRTSMTPTLNGCLGYVRIWDRVLSGSDILNLMINPYAMFERKINPAIFGIPIAAADGAARLIFLSGEI